MYAVRTCLSVAIVAMVSNSTVLINGKKTVKPPEFAWSSEMQGLVLGSFYYGYAVLQIPAGWAVLKIGGKPIFGFGILVASVLALVTPPIVKQSFIVFICLRIAQGLSLGLIASAHHCIWATWSPIFERASLLTIAGSGTLVGTIVTMPVTGLLCDSPKGWPLAFYFIGSLGVLWFIAWQYFMYETPQDHPTITQAEIEFIGVPWNIDEATKSVVPWASILCSTPVWAANFTMFISDWCFYSMLICIPLFMKQVLHFSLSETGFVSALPFVLMTIVSPVSGMYADRLRARGVLSTGAIRKIFQCAGLAASSCFVVAVGYESKPFLSLALLTLGIGSFGLIAAGVGPNLIDLSPKYAGLLMGFSNTMGSLSGFLAPGVVGVLTVHGTLEEWRLVFWLTAVLSLAGILVYVAFGSGKKQSWADN
ncbi:predicted protein [Nematostella vectensis]|uniref:Major facilitator superfamily (MFS) profile domain-containing protein n=2 Tax=Nematostella vectensis TaxID=45351 RepID=A7SX51_NEMVE|nr:vesicular glutamate transporter 1 isoform X2 [Nematostella vectensis]EDO31712.1 predicted protein [Nematostella vectensis]|eukprot:XP_001623812.1 predicted protein [Nematostella vectensis]